MEKKLGHTFFQCSSCEDNFVDIQQSFEVNLKANIHVKITAKENVSAAVKSISLKNKSLKENTKEIYNAINTPFKYGISFAESITSLKEVNIQKKCTTYQKKKERRSIIKDVTEKIEKDWESNAVERLV